MKKIIFLDFDGVLNTEHNQNMLLYKGKAWKDKHGAFFDPKAVAELNRIVEETKADIVIESSWKYLGLEAMRQMWRDRNMPGNVIDVTPSSAINNWLLNANLDEMDPAHTQWKGVEIASWIAENLHDEDRYVIIDDEYVILDSQLPHFILTNPYDGITCIQKQKTVSVSSNYITICSNLFLSKRKIFEKSFEFFYNYIYL